MGIIEGYFVTPLKRLSIIMSMIASGTLRAFLSGFVIFISPDHRDRTPDRREFFYGSACVFHHKHRDHQFHGLDCSNDTGYDTYKRTLE